MDQSENRAGKPPRRELQLQGPRPTPLKVHKDSHKIKKPPPHAGAPPPQHHQPVIIYTVSPKVIHTKASDFMNLVQRLTGLAPSDSRLAASGALSPAARLATIERSGSTSGGRAVIGGSEIVDSVAIDMAELDRPSSLHGILSPVPSGLPGISPSVFLPSPDPSSVNFFHELGGGLFSARNYLDGGLISSPSAFLSAPIPSPNLDFFTHFLDF